jgi:hypothetical protein
MASIFPTVHVGFSCRRWTTVPCRNLIYNMVNQGALAAYVAFATGLSHPQTCSLAVGSPYRRRYPQPSFSNGSSLMTEETVCV